MFDAKMKALEGIMGFADDHAYKGLKKKGAKPDVMAVQVEGSPAEEHAESPKQEAGEMELSPEIIAALEQLLAQAKPSDDDKPAIALGK